MALVTFLTFLPALDNGFVWDDGPNLVDNPHYRGLDASRLRWMFTTTQLGHWIPLTWLTFALDFLAWGPDPRGYHLTNLALHAATAAAFVPVARRLIAAVLTPPAIGEGAGPWLGAAGGALLFALHPLRVESVAWITERRDVLCGLLVVLAGLAYLRHVASGRRWWRSPWYGVAFSLFVLAILAKSIAVMLAPVLLVLDVYPLRRARSPDVLLEKGPWMAAAAAGGVMAIVAAGRSGLMAGVAEVGLLDRLGIALHALGLYAIKSLVPIRLSPFYPLDRPVELTSPPALLGGALVGALSVLAVAGRRRWPAPGAAGVSSLLLLLPVSGLLQNGLQVAADRYTYLPALPWAALAGGGLAAAWGRWPAPRRAALATSTLAVVAGLATLTVGQIGVWRDAERLWRHALTVGESWYAHYNLAVALGQRGRRSEAITHYRRVLALDPGQAEARYNLGVQLAAGGQWEEAIEQYRAALQARPGQVEPHLNWGLALARLGRWDEAIEQYRRVLELRPDTSEARVNWGLALARQGRLEAALEQYREAVRIRAGDAAAHYNWGNALAGLERWDQALEHYREAVRLRPDLAEAHSNLGLALATLGRLDEAIEAFERALRLRPDYAPARQNLEAARARRRALR